MRIRAIEEDNRVLNVEPIFQCKKEVPSLVGPLSTGYVTSNVIETLFAGSHSGRLFPVTKGITFTEKESSYTTMPTEERGRLIAHLENNLPDNNPDDDSSIPWLTVEGRVQEVVFPKRHRLHLYGRFQDLCKDPRLVAWLEFHGHPGDPRSDDIPIHRNPPKRSDIFRIYPKNDSPASFATANKDGKTSIVLSSCSEESFERAIAKTKHRYRVRTAKGIRRYAGNSQKQKNANQLLSTAVQAGFGRYRGPTLSLKGELRPHALMEDSRNAIKGYTVHQRHINCLFELVDCKDYRSVMDNTDVLLELSLKALKRRRNLSKEYALPVNFKAFSQGKYYDEQEKKASSLPRIEEKEPVNEMAGEWDPGKVSSNDSNYQSAAAVVGFPSTMPFKKILRLRRRAWVRKCIRNAAFENECKRLLCSEDEEREVLLGNSIRRCLGPPKKNGFKTYWLQSVVSKDSALLKKPKTSKGTFKVSQDDRYRINIYQSIMRESERYDKEFEPLYLDGGSIFFGNNRLTLRMGTGMNINSEGKSVVWYPGKIPEEEIPLWQKARNFADRLLTAKQEKRRLILPFNRIYIEKDVKAGTILYVPLNLPPGYHIAPIPTESR